jgi:simple sugar transport system ATP-binding protein
MIFRSFPQENEKNNRVPLIRVNLISGTLTVSFANAGNTDMAYLEMRGITKIYGNVIANNNVDFFPDRGEIHALLGENGAGKTTLMKILYGMAKCDSGTISIGGKPAVISSPKDAIALGISMVHQHFMLVDPLTVAENIVLGYEPRRKALLYDAETAAAMVRELSSRFSLKVEPAAQVKNITIGEKQRVEIIKALYRKSDFIILDEPTAVLTSLEVQELFRVLETLKAAGKTIIIITHKLKEVMRISDRVTVLCRGRLVCTRETSGTSGDELAELRVGRKDSAMDRLYGRPVPDDEPVFLELRGISVEDRKRPRLRDVSLQVRRGEILGICGVEGNGQTELLETVTGLRPPDSGSLLVKGNDVTRSSPRAMLEMGVAHISEDRSRRGLVGLFPISSNLVLGYHRLTRFCGRGRLRWQAISEYAEKTATDFDVRTASVYTPVKSLSGGNQQKVMIGRSLAQNPDIIIAAQPTRGVDIGAIEYIHRKLLEMRDAGKAILLVSAEIDELLSLSDTIAVLYEGRIVARGPVRAFDERRLGVLMTGLDQAAALQEGAHV